MIVSIKLYIFAARFLMKIWGGLSQKNEKQHFTPLIQTN